MKYWWHIQHMLEPVSNGILYCFLLSIALSIAPVNAAAKSHIGDKAGVDRNNLDGRYSEFAASPRTDASPVFSPPLPPFPAPTPASFFSIDPGTVVVGTPIGAVQGYVRAGYVVMEQNDLTNVRGDTPLDGPYNRYAALTQALSIGDNVVTFICVRLSDGVVVDSKAITMRRDPTLNLVGRRIICDGYVAVDADRNLPVAAFRSDVTNSFGGFVVGDDLTKCLYIDSKGVSLYDLTSFEMGASIWPFFNPDAIYNHGAFIPGTPSLILSGGSYQILDTGYLPATVSPNRRYATWGVPDRVERMDLVTGQTTTIDTGISVRTNLGAQPMVTDNGEIIISSYDYARGELTYINATGHITAYDGLQDYMGQPLWGGNQVVVQASGNPSIGHPQAYRLDIPSATLTALPYNLPSVQPFGNGIEIWKSGGTAAFYALPNFDQIGASFTTPIGPYYNSNGIMNPVVGYSYSGFSTEPPVPDAPTNLTAVADNRKVRLSWTPCKWATGYNVKRATISGGPYITIASPFTSSYVNTGLTNRTTYYFVVSAFNSQGESGNSAQSSAIPTLPVIDLNGDGKPDLVLQSASSNQVALWYLNGAKVIGGQYLSFAPPAGWDVVAKGDFNRDGKIDLVLQNKTTGEIVIWYLNGTKVIRGQFLSLTSPNSMKVVGVGDFNNDGKLDIVMQISGNPLGELLWCVYLDDATEIGEYYYMILPSGWNMLSVGDFNGDGMPDLVLQNSISRKIALWYLNGVTLIGGAYVSMAPPPGWSVVGAEDFNGDDHVDLVLQNAANNVIALWYLNGASVTGGSYLSTTPAADWKVVGPK